jgi:hypothetical protein
MYLSHKIATCCYCGGVTTLTLTGTSRHQLACASCGAPLSKLKQLPADHGRGPDRHRGIRPEHPKRQKPKRRKPAKRAISRLLDLAEEVFDAFD